VRPKMVAKEEREGGRRPLLVILLLLAEKIRGERGKEVRKLLLPFFSPARERARKDATESFSTRRGQAIKGGELKGKDRQHHDLRAQLRIATQEARKKRKKEGGGG